MSTSEQPNEGGEVLPHLHYCVTHDDLIRGQVVGRCCSSLYDGCLHNHPCDIRRVLVEAHAASQQPPPIPQEGRETDG